jgi:hypothetical protein
MLNSIFCPTRELKNPIHDLFGNYVHQLLINRDYLVWWREGAKFFLTLGVHDKKASVRFINAWRWIKPAYV